jgi:Outer membrane protein and related peptidoglycan-associated (lipo)proteins
MIAYIKHTKNCLWLLLLLLLTSVTAKAQDYKGDVLIEPTTFCERNDSLILSFDIRVESNAVPRCASMTFTPELRTLKNHLQLPYVQVNGKTRSKLNKRWFAVASKNWLSGYDAPYILVDADKYTDETVTYSISLPYESWMDDAALYLRQELIGCREQVDIYTYKLNNRMETEIREPYQIQPYVSMVPPSDEVKNRNRQGSAFLDFQVGRSVILPDFRRNPVELAKINDALVEVMGNMDIHITGLFVEGYASPEGRYTSNDKLARDRATALKNYIRDRYMLSDNMFTVRSVAEDWAGLKSTVESIEIPQKEQILAIIDNSSDYDGKEQQLRGLSSYGRLLRDIFPELRRVEYQINYTVKDYTTAEARTLVQSKPENLSQAELYRVAMEYGTESSEYRKIIIETIPKFYDKDPVANSNAAALLILNKEENTALRMLEKAPNLPAAWNNSGIIYMIRGEYSKAEELFKRAQIAGIPEAEKNLKELQAKKEDDLKRTKKTEE